MNDVQKFKVDDKVWVFHNKENVVEAKITWVKHEDRGIINYHFECSDAKDLTWAWSGFCFATKEECIDYWIKWYEDLIVYTKKEIEHYKGHIRDYEEDIAITKRYRKAPKDAPPRIRKRSEEEMQRRIAEKFHFQVGGKAWVFRGMKPVQVTVLAQPTHWGTDLHSGDYRIKLPGNKGEDWEWPWVMFDTKAECVEHWYNDFVKGIEHCKKRIEGEQLRIKEHKAIIKLLKGSGKVKPSDLQQELP